MWSRRTALQAGALSTLGLAGCLSADGPGTATPTATSTATPTRTPTTARPTYQPSTVSLHLEPVELSAVVDAAVDTRDDLTQEQRDALDELGSDGSYTLEDVVLSDRLPFSTERFVRLDGSVSRIDRETLAERNRTVHRFHVEVLSTTTAEGVPFSDLSSLDQSVFRAGLTEEYRERGTPFAGTFFYTFESRDAAADSRFVSEKSVVVAYRDDRFEVRFQWVDEASERDVRYTLSKLADSEDDFREYVRSEYVRDRSSLSLSSAQHALLDRAIRDRYEEARPLSEPFSGLLETLEQVPTVPNAGRYVRDEETVYQVQESAVDV
jgi:hypothetical protein